MKNLIILLALFSFFSCADESRKPSGRQAGFPRDSNILKPQGNPYAQVDVSPMDMSYFPADFPISKMSGVADGLPYARIIYSRPHRQGREIFGSLIQYGEPWRLGANEATEIEFFRNAVFGGRNVKAGRYTVYCIPEEDKWKIILNTNLYTWGLRPDREKDIASIEVPVEKSGNRVEYFTMVFRPSGQHAELIIAWDSALVRIPVQF